MTSPTPAPRTTNRRVRIQQFGGPEVVHVETEAELPIPGPGEARVRVEASTVGGTDSLIGKGIYPPLKERPPLTLGYDLVGIVDGLGPGVRGLELGQRVADLVTTGGGCDYVVRPVERLMPVPHGLDAAKGAALVLTA